MLECVHNIHNIYVNAYFDPWGCIVMMLLLRELTRIWPNPRFLKTKTFPGKPTCGASSLSRRVELEASWEESFSLFRPLVDPSILG